MEDFQLPPELQQLERELAGRPHPEPSADMRQRVIGRLRGELRGNGLRNGWTFAAGVAATVLVWANLSLSATLATDYGLPTDSPRPPVGAVAEQIQQLLPELSQREALRQALLLQAGSDLVGYPNVSAHPGARGRLRIFNDLLPQGD